MKPRYFIGPMSKNIVDTIIEFCEETNNQLGLIPSRRQVEWDGGYVNNWNTKIFTDYVRSKTDNIILVRDHSGPKQGQKDDDGYLSLKDDVKYLDIIHIDPWKKYPNFSDGVSETIKMINYCFELNPKIQYEIGTEESIRKFESYELDDLVSKLKEGLKSKVFEQIKYLVIQSGTSLRGTNQNGNYDSSRLEEMISVCRYNNLISKEHNGDYIPVSVIKGKFELGLESINIAPEFGLLETNTYLDNIKDEKIFEEYWRICYESKKWEKWVNPEFDPLKNKTEIIKISGHYVLSDPKFLSIIKSEFKDIDNEIKRNIKDKLISLHE
jgi:hypothetical protein